VFNLFKLRVLLEFEMAGFSYRVRAWNGLPDQVVGE